MANKKAVVSPNSSHPFSASNAPMRYLKQGDSITFTLDPQTKQLQNVRVGSYLNDPSNAVKISAEFAQLPDGTNHVASTLINGVSKELTVNEVNSNYQMR